MVFGDQDALARLEAIVHPLVFQALDILIRRSKHSVIVVEAIKLIESGLGDRCDTIWAVYAPQEKQSERLVTKRGMSEAAAMQRILAQSPQDQKIAAAHTLIRNDGTFENTWQQVVNAWNKIFPTIEVETPEAVEPTPGEVLVHRARPREAEEIAALISQLDGERRMTRDDIMAAFGEKAFLLLRVAGRPLGVVGWKVENLVARTDDVHIDGSLSFIDAIQALLGEVERVSRELQCEASLLFLPFNYQEQAPLFQALGYQLRTIQSLGVRAWEEAAQESMPPDSVMFFKQLRQDRVLRPV
jgi:dephospho-CoA kinase